MVDGNVEEEVRLCNVTCVTHRAPRFTVCFWIDPELPNLAGAGGGGGSSRSLIKKYNIVSLIFFLLYPLALAGPSNFRGRSKGQ